MNISVSAFETMDALCPKIDPAHIRAGHPFILIEKIAGELVGTMAIAAEFATANQINGFARDARGLICLAMHEAIVDRLGLPLMTQRNRIRRGPSFTVSIEAREGISTGISTQDRANTIAAAIRDGAGCNDLATPGHVFPIRVEENDLKIISSAAAAAVEMCRHAGLVPAAVVCAVLGQSGELANLAELESLASGLGLPIACTADATI